MTAHVSQSRCYSMEEHILAGRPPGLHRLLCRLGLDVDDVKAAPRWANRINSALELAPMGSAIAFVLIDLGSAALLLAIIIALNITVTSEFVLAYTVCKSAVRVPRMALDASGAALLARLWPALAKVRISLMIDAVSRIAMNLQERVSPASAQTGKTRSQTMDRVGHTIKQLTDKYGLAYMAAKNVIGPVTILLLYAALRASGGDSLMAYIGSRFGIAANGAGLLASRMCLVHTHTHTYTHTRP